MKSTETLMTNRYTFGSLLSVCNCVYCFGIIKLTFIHYNNYIIIYSKYLKLNGWWNIVITVIWIYCTLLIGCIIWNSFVLMIAMIQNTFILMMTGIFCCIIIIIYFKWIHNVEATKCILEVICSNIRIHLINWMINYLK